MLIATSHTASSTAPMVPVHVHACVAPVSASTSVSMNDTVLTTAANPTTNPCALSFRMTDLPWHETLPRQSALSGPVQPSYPDRTGRHTFPLRRKVSCSKNSSLSREERSAEEDVASSLAFNPGASSSSLANSAESNSR